MLSNEIRVSNSNLDSAEQRLAPAITGSGIAPATPRLERPRVRFGFAGEYIANDATISFSVTSGGVTYTSVDAGQKAVGSAVGREHNGVFFE
jgi:hypothetical protein